MKAIIRHPFARTVLLVAAMVTAYGLGREHIVALAGQRETQTRRSQSVARLEEIQQEVAKAAAMHPGGQFKLGDAIITANSLNHCCINGVDVDELMAKDPDAALVLLKTLPPGDTALWIYAWAFRYAMQQDLDKNPAIAEKLAKIAAALPSKPVRLQVEEGIAEAWSDKDPNGALKWARGLPPGDAPTLKTVLGFLAQQDGAYASQYVDNIQDATVRNEAILAIATRWREPSSTRQLTPNPFAEGDALTSNTQYDAGAALKWLGQVAAGSTYAQGVQDIAREAFEESLASTGNRTDALDSTRALLNQVTDPSAREAALLMTANFMGDYQNPFSAWDTEDDSAALNWLQTLPPDAGAVGKTMSTVLDAWMQANPDAAMAYFQSANNTTLMQEAEPIVAVHLSESDPAAAIAWANNLPAGEGKWQTIGALAAYMDEDNATALLKPLADSLGQDANTADAVEIATEVAGEFVQDQNDPLPRMTNLASWVRQLPAGEVQDAAAVQYVQAKVANAFFTQDQDTVLSIANAISDGPTRDAQVQAAVLAIAKTDLVAAANAAQKANISPDERQMLAMLLFKPPSP